MPYSANPRKIYGKVEVIFSDTDISSIEEVTTSSASAISHPYEVYSANIVPTVKACTMDGNSTLDSTFQMMDEGCVLGWWSGELSNSNGEFAISPTLELSFSPRPILSWLIVGDVKLNQYPENFTIEYYQNGILVESQSIISNTQVQRKIYNEIEDITSLKITIQKWNKPNATVKLLKFFDKLAETYLENDLKEFEVNEEMFSEDANYNINSDTMTVTIYNREQKFSVGYLKNLLILDRKVKPYIGTDVNGIITYTQLGTFYSDEWQVDEEGGWVKCIAVDKLMRLQSKIYIGYPLSYNSSLYDIIADILVKSGFTNDQFYISSDLTSVLIPMAFMPKQTVWDALQDVANAGLCKVFVDRSDRINIISENETHVESGIEVNTSNMFGYKSNISLTEFANRVSVEYCDVELTDDFVEAASTAIVVDGNSTMELTIDYNLDVTDATIEVSNPSLLFDYFSSGINACGVKIRNSSSSIEEGTITIKGFAIDITYKTVFVQDENSIRDYGAFDYKHPSSDLVQSSVRAIAIATTLMNKLKTGEGVITTIWRGNPSLELGKTYRTKNKHNQENVLICEYNKLSFDGGLKQETRGRKI